MASRSRSEPAPAPGASGFPEGAPCWIDVAAPDPRAAARFYRQAGGELLSGPFAVPEAGRAAVCADPAGATFRVWQPKAHPGVQLADAPNAWLRSDLNTPDPARSAAFYADVFGWEAHPIDDGDNASCVIRLPRIAMSQGGVEDAIGRMTQISSTATRLQPHWSVTFRVEDVDATARACADLGGMVVSPPFDAGTLTRAAILSDPFGAMSVDGASCAATPPPIQGEPRHANRASSDRHAADGRRWRMRSTRTSAACRASERTGATPWALPTCEPHAIIRIWLP